MTPLLSPHQAKPFRFDCPTIDEWILAVLTSQEDQTLDALGQALPEVNWAQFFLVIDRLSRSGKIALWPLQHGDYRVTRKCAA